MKKIIAIILLLFTENSYATTGLTTAGDILQIAIPTAAFGVATYKSDREGQKEFAKSFIVTMGATYAAKFAFRNTSWGTRPNGGADSFPSGHSSSAFGGAFFLQKRYGIMYGAPAIALATFTGYTRTKGEYHHWRDVIGSMAIAGGANFFLVNKYDSDKMKVTADIGKDIAILNLKMDL